MGSCKQTLSFTKPGSIERWQTIIISCTQYRQPPRKYSRILMGLMMAAHGQISVFLWENSKMSRKYLSGGEFLCYLQRKQNCQALAWGNMDPPRESQTLGKGDAADWDSGTTDSRKRWEMLSDVSTVTTTTGAVMVWEQAQIRHRGSFLFSCLACQVRNKAQNSKALSSIYIASGVCSWPNCYLWVLLLLFILTDSLFPYTWRWYLDQCCSLPAK